MAVSTPPVRRPPAFAGRPDVTFSPRTVGLAVIGAAALAGLLTAWKAPAGVAIVLACCYAAVALLDPFAGLVLWIPLAFLEGFPVLNAGGKAAGLLVALAWMGAAGRRADTVGEVLRRHRGLTAGIVGLLTWQTLSVIWATSPYQTVSDLWHWYVIVLMFFVVATSVTSLDRVRIVIAAFLIGAVLSVLSGLLGGALANPTATAQATESGRLYGAAGDPNYLAAALAPAMVLAAVLFALTREASARLWLAVATLVTAYGLFASESRGGLIAALVTIVTALIVLRARRAWVVSAALIGVAVAVAFFAITPGAWSRVTHFNDGSGRSDVWKVAERVIEDHPVLGVGLNNFPVVAKQYTAQPGELKDLQLIVDRPHVTHNIYLQFLADTGIIGLLLFLTIVGACIHAAFWAAHRFEALGDDAGEAISRALVVALIGMLSASLFISNGVDKRLWILFALGPALAGIASRERLPGAP